MGLKSALFKMKQVLANNINENLNEDYIQDLEAENRLNPGTLIYYYNQMMILGMNKTENHSPEDSKKVNRKWKKTEIEFMFQYIKERQEEGALNITEILDEAAQLLDRGYQSVNYKYYSLIKAKDQKRQAEQNHVQYTTITDTNVPVLSVEPLPVQKQSNQISELNPVESSGDDGLLEILSGLITNVQQLPGINLNDLLRSLYQLTTMALQNQGVAQQMESMKSEISHEKEAMKQNLLKKEQQLLLEKKRNDELQAEVSKLAQEITAFNKLGDAAKIQNLKSYNQRLNYIIDHFGVVLQVGS